MTAYGCPFCGRDPFHYVNNGLGMEAVAVTCCDLGDMLFRGQRPAPEEVTLSWDQFTEIASKINRNSLESDAERDAPPVTGSQPIVIDDDNDEIIVSLDGRELRGWNYADNAERRQKMLQAREYVEGWCDGREA